MIVNLSVKSLTHKAKISTIKLERYSAAGDVVAQQHVAAVYALLGGYNEVARNVDLEQYAQLKEDFERIVEKLAYAMAVNPKAER